MTSPLPGLSLLPQNFPTPYSPPQPPRVQQAAGCLLFAPAGEAIETAWAIAEHAIAMAQAIQDGTPLSSLEPWPIVDRVYARVYPQGPIPIPQNWAAIPNCKDWVDAWLRINSTVVSLIG